MPYRDDRHALEAHRESLRREIAEMTARVESLGAAVREKEAAERELSALEARIARMDARRATMLEDVRIASPCNAGWDDMIGDDKARFCGQCRKNVYNLSAMTRAEAEALLEEREGSMCVRLYRRADGTVLTADCPDGLRNKRVRLAVISAGAGLFAAAGIAGFAATTCTMGAVRPVQGEVAYTPPEPHYVDQPVNPRPAAGLVMRYTRAARPGAAGEAWELFADGHVIHAIDGGAAEVKAATPETQRAASALLDIARRARPTGAGVTLPHADSAVGATFELYGTGGEPLSEAERSRVFEVAASIPR